MDPPLRDLVRPEDPLTRAATRRQLLLEVYLPLGAAIALVVGLAVVAGMVGYGSAGTWADLTLVVLAFPLAVVLVFVLGGMIAASVLLARLMQEIPGVAGGLRSGIDEAARVVQRGSEVAVTPVIIPRAASAGLAEAVRSIRALISGGLWGRDG